MLGHGGDDIFTVGFEDIRLEAPYVKPTLNTIKGRVVLEGGAGLDRVRVDHRQGTGLNFEIYCEFVEATDSLGRKTSFAGINYRGFEGLRLSTGAYLNNNLGKVNVWANDATHYEIVTRTHRPAGTEKTPTWELVEINGSTSGRQFVPAPDSDPLSIEDGTASGTWRFENERRSVKISRVDSISDENNSPAQLDRWFANDLDDLLGV